MFDARAAVDFTNSCTACSFLVGAANIPSAEPEGLDIAGFEPKDDNESVDLVCVHQVVVSLRVLRATPCNECFSCFRP